MSVTPSDPDAAPEAPAKGGVLALVLAALCFSIMSLLVKLAGANVPMQQIVLIRGLFGLLFAYWLVRRARLSLWGNRRGLLWLRGIFGFAALSCFYYSVIHLPLAEATVIQYTNPIWTLLLAALVLGERLTWRVGTVGVMGLVGVVLIARPSFLFGAPGAALDPSVVAVALTGAVMSACAYVTVRKLSGTEATVVIVFYFTLVTVIGALPWTLVDAVWPSAYEWALLFAVGLTALVGQLYLTRGLRREEAGRATSVGYIQVLFAAGWGLLFFGEYLDGWAIGGALIILGSVLTVARERRRALERAARPEQPTVEI